MYRNRGTNTIITQRKIKNVYIGSNADTGNYFGLIELDTLILDNTIHYRGEHEYKTYTSEFKTEALA